MKEPIRVWDTGPFVNSSLLLIDFSSKEADLEGLYSLSVLVNWDVWMLNK